MVQWLSQEYLTFFSGILSGIFSAILSDIFSGIMSNICSDILSGSLAFYLACVRYGIRVQAVRSCTFVKIDPRQIGK